MVDRGQQLQWHLDSMGGCGAGSLVAGHDLGEVLIARPVRLQRRLLGVFAVLFVHI